LWLELFVYSLPYLGFTSAITHQNLLNILPISFSQWNLKLHWISFQRSAFFIPYPSGDFNANPVQWVHLLKFFYIFCANPQEYC